MSSIISRIFYLAAVSAALPSILAAADDSLSTDKHVTIQEHAYFGVKVTSAHSILSANLNGLLKPEQGLAVDEVAQNSAAMNAGIKINDVLTSYDNQMLFSPEQLAKLVDGDKPGRNVDIQVLRNGKLEHLFVTLGKRDIADFRAWSPSSRSQPYRFGPPDHIPRRFQAHPLPAAEWENFDSLVVKKIAPDTLHVELQHREQDGNVHKHVFEGTREEIHKAINAAKDMKTAERGHLLRALNLYDPGNAAPFPHIWFEPGLGWFFEQSGGPFH